MRSKLDFVNGTAWEPRTWQLSENDSFDGLPRITIAILSYNRAPDLRITLDAITHGNPYPDREIIVIDNASTDNTAEMVSARFPEVTFIQNATNVGTHARNEFAKLASGKYIFFFDDDSMPASPSTFLRIVRFLESHPEIAGLNSICYRPKSRVTETKGWDSFFVGEYSEDGCEGLFLVEGGICLRTSALRKVAGYDARIFWGSEGAELAMQCYRAGLRLLLAPWSGTLHMCSDLNRSDKKRAYWLSQNSIAMLAKHFPAVAFIPMLMLYIARRFLMMALWPKLASQAAIGLLAGLRRIPEFRRDPKLSLNEMIGLRRWYFWFYRW